MSRVFAAVSLDAMLSLLSEYQLVHQQKRIDSGNHVEEESKNWVSTFNLDVRSHIHSHLCICKNTCIMYATAESYVATRAYA